MVRFIELFAGIGGFRYGLENVAACKRTQQGISKKGQTMSCDRKPCLGTQQFACVWANEIDKYACQIYRKNFGKGELYEGDIRTVRSEDISEAEMLTAGFPCQAFSVAGKRKGFEDTRGTLFYEIARLARAKRYKILLLENVYGLLSHEGGDTFATILGVLDEVGYDVEWQVLNSKNFGVPQNRERVFIVGHLRGEGGPEVFPIGEGSGKNIVRHKKENYTADYRGDEGLRIREDGITPTMKKRAESRDHYNSILTFKKDMKIRRLTPTECERLQGFPDGWTDGISDTQRYRCLGNAVTVNVIRAIGEAIWTSLQEKSEAR